MELGKNVLARRELSTVYLVTLKVAAPQPTAFCLFSPIVPQNSLSYFHINCNSISSDSVPYEEDIIEDDQQVDETEEPDDDEDEMADFIVEEDEIDGNGQVVRCGSLCSYLLPTS
jgi:hypothetical protein